VPITGRWRMAVQTAGGAGAHSATKKWVWSTPHNISAQAALTAFGGADIAEAGFSAFVKNGAYSPIGNQLYGTRRSTFFSDGITELRLEVRCWDGWAEGCAVGYSWS
jgi:hypothetical protein